MFVCANEWIKWDKLGVIKEEEHNNCGKIEKFQLTFFEFTCRCQWMQRKEFFSHACAESSWTTTFSNNISFSVCGVANTFFHCNIKVILFLTRTEKGEKSKHNIWLERRSVGKLLVAWHWKLCDIIHIKFSKAMKKNLKVTSASML